MDNSTTGNTKIAVIGLGPAGLTAIKALREEGFDVVGFERRDRVGGIWRYSPNLSYTSVIHDTVSNVSKFVVSGPVSRASPLLTIQSGFSDFPLPKEYPPFMSGAQVAEYLEEYAKHFGLEQHVLFKTTVRRILRDELDRGWNVDVCGPEGDAVLHFDKVVLGSGSDSVPSWPRMPGRDLFQGTVLHGQSYRRPEQFAGQRVLVVGIGNTACDVALSLSSHASKVYQSYRHGRIIVSRYSEDGVPCDSKVPWPGLRLQDMLDHKLPWVARSITDRAMRKVMIDVAARGKPQDRDPKEPRHSARDRRKLAAERIKGDWRLVPCASVAHVHPVEQERFIPALQSGQITPTRGFKEFTGVHRVLLDDGSSLEVDAVVFCTGYKLEFDMMPELEMNGACGLPLTTVGETQVGSGAREPHLPRLYQMIFPPRWASSLALLSWMSPLETYWCVCELASMAVAQAWAAETAKEQGLAQPVDGHRRPALATVRGRDERRSRQIPRVVAQRVAKGAIDASWHGAVALLLPLPSQHGWHGHVRQDRPPADLSWLAAEANGQGAVRVAVQGPGQQLRLAHLRHKPQGNRRLRKKGMAWCEAGSPRGGGCGIPTGVTTC